MTMGRQRLFLCIAGLLLNRILEEFVVGTNMFHGIRCFLARRRVTFQHKYRGVLHRFGITDGDSSGVSPRRDP